jgi:hypothetical protein
LFSTEAWPTRTSDALAAWTNPAAARKKIRHFVIFVLHSTARGSTLRLFKLYFQYSTEHTGSGVSGVALSLWGQGAHIFNLAFGHPPLLRRAVLGN